MEASLRASGLISDTVWRETMALLDNPRFWTWQNSYVATAGRTPAA